MEALFLDTTVLGKYIWLVIKAFISVLKYQNQSYLNGIGIKSHNGIFYIISYQVCLKSVFVGP